MGGYFEVAGAGGMLARPGAAVALAALDRRTRKTKNAAKPANTTITTPRRLSTPSFNPLAMSESESPKHAAHAKTGAGAESISISIESRPPRYFAAGFIGKACPSAFLTRT